MSMKKHVMLLVFGISCFAGSMTYAYNKAQVEEDIRLEDVRDDSVLVNLQVMAKNEDTIPVTSSSVQGTSSGAEMNTYSISIYYNGDVKEVEVSEAYYNSLNTSDLILGYYYSKDDSIFLEY